MVDQNGSPVIAIVAGEISGDILGAGLIKELKRNYPHTRFIGIAGQNMFSEGCESLFSLEELSVMGLIEVVKHLPRLLKIRRQLINIMLTTKPDIFIGIDAPDFNIGVELQLKRHGIKTIHYVSPSIWAWRQNRIYKIARATHLVLALLPFEKKFYDRFNIPCKFVGHTMADAIPIKPDRSLACELLGIDEQLRYVAILPGSRESEIELLSKPFLEAALLIQQKYPAIHFLVPCVNLKCRLQFEKQLAKYAPKLAVTLLFEQARQAMIIAEATLLASGTASLEAMLCKSPMVVGYRMKSLTYFLAKRLVKIKYISLPNLLADEMLVPELIQHDCTAENIAQKLDQYLSQDADLLAKRNALIERFTALHQLIKCDADKKAAQAVIEIMENNSHVIV